MSDTALLSAFKEWKNRVGDEVAITELARRKINLRTVDDLLRGDYAQSPRRKLRRALEEILGLAS